MSLTFKEEIDFGTACWHCIRFRSHRKFLFSSVIFRSCGLL